MARDEDAATSSDGDDISLDFARSHARMLQNKTILSNNVLTKRKEQLHKWETSEMNHESTRRRGRAKVQFQDSDIFLSACMSGDEDEVDELLAKGADINTSTVDGLTALHQSVIDSHPEMVRFLCMRGADVNAQDNEGWTPLHAAACCGNTAIVQLLINNGADLHIINSDKELALDLAEDEACREVLAREYRRQGIEPDECRDEEERAMKRDAEAWIRDGVCRDSPHWRTGAYALHVAAAKGYTQVMELLLKAGANVSCRDREGWAPLHAAAHWGERDACKILMEHGASLDDLNLAGQNVLAVADKEIVEYLEELQKAREKRAPSVPHTGSVLSEQNVRVTGTPPSTAAAATVVVPPSPAAVNGHRQSSVPHILSTEEKHALTRRDERDENAAQVARRLSGDERPSISPDKAIGRANGTDSESSEKSSEAGSSVSSHPSQASTKSTPSTASVSGSGVVSDDVSERSSAERSTTSESSVVSASGTSSSASSAASAASAASKGSSAVSGDQNVAVTIKRPWVSRTREAEVKTPEPKAVETVKPLERPSVVETPTTTPGEQPSSIPVAKPISPKPSPTVQRSTSTPTSLTWTASPRHIGPVVYPPFLAHQTPQRASAFRPVAPSSPTARPQMPPPSTSTPWNRAWQTPPTIPTSSRESEAERRKESRVQRQSRRSTQGVTKEQLAEARELADSQELNKKPTDAASSGRSDASSIASTASSTRNATATFTVPNRQTNATAVSDQSDTNSDRSTWLSESSRSSTEKSSTASSEEPSESKRSASSTSSGASVSAGLTITLPSQTPSANNIRRKSQGLGFNRANRRGTGPVAVDDLAEARAAMASAPAPPPTSATTATVAPLSVAPSAWESPRNSYLTRLGAINSAMPRTTSYPERLLFTSTTTALTQLLQSSSGSRPGAAAAAASPSVGVARQSGPFSPTVSTPTYTGTQHISGHESAASSHSGDINYKTLYEAERKENDKLRRELDDMRSRTASQEITNGTASAFRRVSSRFSTGGSKEGSPLSAASVSKSSSAASMDEQQKRTFERKIAEMEFELKGLSQLRLENQRLKEENGALVRVISKMTL